MRPSVFITSFALVAAGAFAHNKFHAVIVVPESPLSAASGVDPHQAFDAVFFEDTLESSETLGSISPDQLAARAFGLRADKGEGQATRVKSNPYID